MDALNETDLKELLGYSVEIKKCPFCGQPAFICHLDNGQYYPRCTGGSGSFCLMTRTPDLENDGFIHVEDAIHVWNRRPKRNTS